MQASAQRCWIFSPVPLGRIAVLRTIAYLFIPLDVFVFTRFGQVAMVVCELASPLILFARSDRARYAVSRSCPHFT